MNASSTSPTHTISLNRQIYCFEISPFEWSTNLVCAALENKLVVGLLHFPEEYDAEEIQWEQLKEFSYVSRCHVIAFAPDTSLLSLPKQVTFCVAGSDYRLHIFRSDLQEMDSIQCLQSHTNYVNDVVWEPTKGKYLASVSDDHTCEVRSRDDNFESSIMFRFKSPAMSVHWHPEDIDKFMVAEQRGTIHMINIVARQTILSIETGKAPLMSADWCTRNQLFVTALVAGEVIAYDLRRPYRAAHTRAIHEDGGLSVRYSPNSELVVASIGRPNCTLKVIHLKSEIPQLTASLKLFGGMCWHQRLSYVAVADDDKIKFWKVNSK